MISGLLRRYKRFLNWLHEYETVLRALDPDSDWIFAEEKSPDEAGHFLVIVRNVDNVLRVSAANYDPKNGWDQQVVLWHEEDPREKVRPTGDQNP